MNIFDVMKLLHKYVGESGMVAITYENLLIFSFEINYFLKLVTETYRIIALKKTIKTSINFIKFLFINIKRYSSFDRCERSTCVGSG